jgi:hypothetical protein
MHVRVSAGLRFDISTTPGAAFGGWKTSTRETFF